MKIVENKFKSYCVFCCSQILLKEYPFKVKHGQDTFHLICFYKWLKKRVEKLECSLSELKKFKKQMNKYKTQLMLETLEQKA